MIVDSVGFRQIIMILTLQSCYYQVFERKSITGNVLICTPVPMPSCILKAGITGFAVVMYDGRQNE